MIQKKMLYARSVMVFAVMVIAGAVAGVSPVFAASNDVEAGKSDAVHSGVIPSPEEVSMRALRLKPGLPHYQVQYQAGTGEGGFVAAGGEPVGSDDPVYINEPPPDIIFPPGAGRLIADDLVTVAVGGCSITGYEIVVGRANARCSIDQQVCETDDDCADFGGQTCQPYEDPGFTVDFGLYDGCPMAGGQLIPGTDGTMTFTENSIYTIVVDFSDSAVFFDGQVWLGTEFDRAGAGWAVGTPAARGFTENVYDFPIPAFACSARFTGSPLYAGFHAKIFCSDDPPFEREFLAYFNPEVTGPTIAHPSGASNRFLADDLRLIVDDCVMTSYAIGVSGSSSFTATTEIWRGCSPAQVVEGTQGTFDAIGDGSPEFARFSFPEGIDLGTGNIWIAVKQSIASSGPIQANEATLGETDSTFGIFDWPGQADGCGWILVGTHTGFAASVSCLGDAPTGACCDLVTVNDVGDEPTCRELTQIACSGSLTRYNQGTSCPNTCLVDNLPCASDGDCEPNVCSRSLEPCAVTEDCPDPDDTCEAQTCVPLGESFDPPCGTSACCTPPNSQFGEACVDLPIEECITILDNDDNPAIWNRGTFCDNPDFGCFRWVCRYADGDCDIAHGQGVGCNVPSCCDLICDQDPFCCEFEWDQTCADRVQDEDFGCPDIGNSPDECVDAIFTDVSIGRCSGGGECDFSLEPDDCPGLEVCNLPSVKLNTVDATAGPLETFCCTTLSGGSAGGGGVWTYFIAPAGSIVITTDDGGPGTAEDPVIEVYRAADPSTPESSCDSLVQVGCDDDSGDGNQARLVLHDLNQGEKYYVLLAAKGAAFQGVYKIEFEWPAEDPDNTPTNNACESAFPVAAAQSIPFDLAGATVSCPWETCLPSTIPNDPDPTLIDND
ncbi:MAG: hypothetical protein ACYTHJ_19405, partial [Planctomycetota bacterium]